MSEYALPLAVASSYLISSLNLTCLSFFDTVFSSTTVTFIKVYNFHFLIFIFHYTFLLTRERHFSCSLTCSKFRCNQRVHGVKDTTES